MRARGIWLPPARHGAVDGPPRPSGATAGGVTPQAGKGRENRRAMERQRTKRREAEKTTATARPPPARTLPLAIGTARGKRRPGRPGGPHLTPADKEGVSGVSTPAATGAPAPCSAPPSPPNSRPARHADTAAVPRSRRRCNWRPPRHRTRARAAGRAGGAPPPPHGAPTPLRQRQRLPVGGTAGGCGRKSPRRPLGRHKGRGVPPGLPRRAAP